MISGLAPGPLLHKPVAKTQWELCHQPMTFIDLASWAVFGAGVQGLARGVQQKPLNYKPIGFVYSALAFVGVGYLLNGVRLRQQEFLDSRIALLTEERAQRGVEFQRE